MAKKYDPDERFALNIDLDEALEILLDGAGTADEDWELDSEGTDSEE